MLAVGCASDEGSLEQHGVVGVNIWSGIICRAAYEIISQQSMAGIDISDVEQWLWPGFRRATKPGEGYRVDTKFLYASIDYMSPL